MRQTKLLVSMSFTPVINADINYSMGELSHCFYGIYPYLIYAIANVSLSK